jgi:hypothetical protein
MKKRSFAAVSGIVLLLVLLLAGASLALAATGDPVLCAGYEPQGSYEYTQTLGSVKLAQSFTAITGGKLVSADALLYTHPSAPGSMQAALYNITGTYGLDSVPTGEALAISLPVPANTPGGWVTFTFSGTDLTLEAEANYALVLSYDGVMAGPEWYESYFSASYSGNMAYKESAGEWTPFWSGYYRDHYFRIHVSSAETPASLVEELVAHYDEWLELGEEGGLAGVAKTATAAAGKAKAFGNMLVEAQEYINAGQWGEALSQLESAGALCDGKPSPSDFVDGDAREELCAAVEELIEAVFAAME